MKLEIRPVKSTEMEKAFDLVNAVFDKQVADSWEPEGVEQFRKDMREAASYISMGFGEQRYLAGAFIRRKIVGVVCYQPMQEHIQFLFVDIKHQRQGIGRALLRHIYSEYPGESEYTVYAALPAVPFYERCGYVKYKGPQTLSGMTYQSMGFKVPK